VPRYRVLNLKHNIKEVVWDISEHNPVIDRPTLYEVNEAADKEYPGVAKSDLRLFGSGGGEGVHLVRSR